MAKTKRESKRVDKRAVFKWDDEESSENEEESDGHELPTPAPAPKVKTRPANVPYDPANYNPDHYYSLRDMAYFDAYGTLTPSQRRAWESKK